MKWKKILKYTLNTLLISTIVMSYLAKRDIFGMYGGLTEVVDAAQFIPEEGPIAIINTNVLSPDGMSMISDQNVIVENGIIQSIDTLSEIPSHMKIVDGEDKYLIPGLVDSHVHLFKSQNDLLLYVANGVTQIREMIGDDDILEWREEVRGGRLGPDMYVASPRMGSFGMLEGWFMSWTQGFMNIQTAEEAKREVTKLHANGYDAVKIYSHLNKESYDAINDTAAGLGMDVVGHIPWSISIDDVLNSKQSELAHLEELMNALNREYQAKNELKPQFHSFDLENGDDFLVFVDERSKELAPLLIENDISVTTTLWLTKSFVRQIFDLENVLKEVELEYENPGISEWKDYIPQGLAWLPENNRYKLPEGLTAEDLVYQKAKWERYGNACQIIVKNLSDNGVNIMAGTDCNLPPTVPGFSLHDELISLNNAGMSTAEVLQSATTIPGKWLDNNAGSMAPGYKANLVLLDKNPLEDISNTKAINMVFLNGKILDRVMLDGMLDAVRDANNKSRKKDISRYVGEEVVQTVTTEIY